MTTDSPDIKRPLYRPSELIEPIHRYDDKAARAWLYSSVFWLMFVTLVGLTIATELITPNLFGGVPYLLFSRIRCGEKPWGFGQHGDGILRWLWASSGCRWDIPKAGNTQS